MVKILSMHWLWLLCLLTVNVSAGTIKVTLVDDQSGSPMSNIRVSVDRLESTGKFKWVAGGDTDQSGQISFEVASRVGDQFRVRAKVYGHWMNSEIFSAPHSISLRAGTLPVTVIREATGQPLPGWRVAVSRRKSDGKWQWLESANTDHQGKIRFSPAGLGQGGEYRLQAKSPVDGSWLFSKVFTQPGRMTFMLGNIPLSVQLTDANSGAKLSGVDVVVHEVLADGSLRWIRKMKTDAQGKVVFDLPGLGKGRQYVLIARPYGLSVKSGVITETGNFVFKVGALPVQVVSESNGSPLTGIRVTVARRGNDGKWKGVQSGVSDSKGLIHFDPPGLGEGGEYRLQAKSPVDGSWIVSDIFTQPAPMTFTYGNLPLRVQLTDANSGAKLSGVDVAVHEVLADGSLRWVRKMKTGAQGKVVFDLPGLGKGRRYVLTAKPYGINVKSRVIAETGNFVFKVGALPVRVVSGGNGSPLTGIRVTVAHRGNDGKWKGVQSGVSDGKGLIHFDPPGLGEGGEYRLQAKSPVDGTWIYSDEFSQPGKRTFVLGNSPLRVRLTNELSSVKLAGVAITAREILADGSLRWAKRLVTDENGEAVFDLEGLGKGRKYRLDAQPYEIKVRTGGITAPGVFDFKVGALPVTLKDRNSGQPLSGRELVLWEKASDGGTVWKNKGVTNSAGMVRFDELGLGKGKVYLIEARDPFGKGRSIFSPPVFTPGAVTFEISANDPSGLDRKAPELVIVSPANSGKVAAAGFQVRGWARDKRGKVQRVRVTVNDPATGTHQFDAQIDGKSGNWLAEIPSQTVTIGKFVTIQVEVFDDRYNRLAKTIRVQVIDDRSPPEITLLSPTAGDLTPMGFLVTGTVADESNVAQVVGKLSTAQKGGILTKTLEVSGNGRWAFAIPPHLLDAGDRVTVLIEAKDDAGHLRQVKRTYSVIGVAQGDRHLLNRITFGATPELLKEIRLLGRQEFLRRQLHPEEIDDSAAESLVSKIALNNTDDLRQRVIYRMLFSQRQLNEVMTWFWENHFNTFRGKTALNWEVVENQAFRAYALGKFRDLLQISATSAAMVKYLDNIHSRKNAINENYARELMELHTVGINGGYTHRDIVEVARAFTGWRIDWDNWAEGHFIFNAKQHDFDEKIVLGHVLPAGQGIEDGQQVLDILASHPSTARFICTKLAKVFVSDKPSAATISDCATVFLDSDGDIRQVVENLLTSEEFTSAQSFHAKFKTPIEYVATSVRALQPKQVGSRDLLWELRRMAMNLFSFPHPTGWPEVAEKWVDSNQMMARFYFANHLAARLQKPEDARITYANLPEYFSGLGLETAEGIVGYLFQILTAGDYTPMEWKTAMNFLKEGKTFGFSLQDTDANRRLQQLTGYVLALPQAQLQ